MDQLRWIIGAVSIMLGACASQPLQNSEHITHPLKDKRPLVHTSQPEKASQAPQRPQDSTLDSYSAPQARVDSVSQASQSAVTELRNEPNDIWVRIREGFELPSALEQPRVRKHLAYYRSHPKYLWRVTTRAEPFLHFILEEIERRALPTDLVLLPVIESAYRPFAYSHGRAAGLWQFIPSTGKLYGLEQNWWYDGRRDVYAATHAALDYLTSLNKRFKGDWLLTLAAYNAGPNAVSRAIDKNRRKSRPTSYWYLDLPRETDNYVPKLLALKTIVEDPQNYRVKLLPIENKRV